MTTTVTLDEETGSLVRQYADSREISLDQAISELVLQAARPKSWIKYVDGIPVFDVPRGATISDELVKTLIAEEV